MGIISEKDVLSGEDITRILERKRKKAIQHLDETGSLPDWWELGISVQLKYATRKYDSPKEYFEHGVDFFRHWATRGVRGLPTLDGLILWMGFASRQTFEEHARRNPDFRPAHSTLMTMLRMPLEQALTLPGNNTTGALFRLKNIPDGWTPEDDRNTPSRYFWKERRSTELTGSEGGPIRVEENAASPEETYLKMLQAGARLTKSAGEILRGDALSSKDSPE